MYQVYRSTAIAILASSTTHAFVTSPSHQTPLPTTRAANDYATDELIACRLPGTQIYNTKDNYAQDNEVEQMMRMTTELRAGAAASLEPGKAKQLAESIEDPTVLGNILSTMPYIFPLIDGLQYGHFLFGAKDVGTDPFVVALGVSLSRLRSVPLLGVIPFFALNILSKNTCLNPLLKFNAQQAIFIEIALVFPSMILRLDRLILGGTSTPTLQLVVEIFNDTTFGVLLLTVLYCVGCSLLGKQPNEIPLVSRAVSDRISMVDMHYKSPSLTPSHSRLDRGNDCLNIVQ